MELIFIFAIVLIKVFLSHLFKIVEIIRAHWINTFMYAEEFAVFLGNKGISTMRAGESDGSCNNFTGAEGLPTDLALVLTITTIVVIDVMVRSTTQRADGILRNGFTIATLNRFDKLAIFPLIVFQKELPVLFNKGFDNRKFVNLEFLVLGGMGIIESPLLQRYVSANKV